jgi:hypothetical protein
MLESPSDHSLSKQKSNWQERTELLRNIFKYHNPESPQTNRKLKFIANSSIKAHKPEGVKMR